jgi:hypothetical protein
MTDDGVEHPTGEGLPSLIEELSEACRQYVLSTVGVELDYTPETLPVLDQYLSVARAGMAERPELAPLVTRAAGAYFGRMIADLLDGFWLHADADVDRWRVCASPVFLAVNPAGIVAEALAGDSDATPNGKLLLAREDEALVARRLEAAPPLPEDEYFLLSTRLEALELALEALSTDQGGLGTATFTAEDYADLE